MGPEEIFARIQEFVKRFDAPVVWELARRYNGFQVLIASILSARTRDEVTMRVAIRLFSKVKCPEDLLEMDELELVDILRPLGFFRQKAKYLKEVSRILIEKHDSKVPCELNALLELPGVGRKVANLVLSILCHKDAISVDTHVHRVANRIGLVRTRRVEETEEELKKIFPKRIWSNINPVFVTFGKKICRSLKPKCSECPVKEHCKYYKSL